MSLEVILLAEDKHLAELVITLLEKRGHTVLPCVSAAEGMRVICETPPDVVIVGDALSDMDGITFLARIRKQTEKVKIVYVSRFWPEPDLYRVLSKDLLVSLIFERPLKSKLFGPQIEALFQNWNSAEDEEQEESESSILLSFKQKFLASLPQRLRQMELILNEAKNGRSDRAGVEELKRLAHNLKGTAKSCGFDRLGGEAETMEKSLNSMLEHPGDRPAKVFETVSKSMARTFQYLQELSADRADSGLDNESHDGLPPLGLQVLVVGKSELPERSAEMDSQPSIEFVAADCLSDALEKATLQLIDAALIDYTDEAFSQARTIRDLSNCEDLPLGIICGDGEKIDRADAVYAGFSAVIDLPCSANQVRDSVMSLAAGREGRRPRILVVDDDPDLADLVALTLGAAGMLVHCVCDPLNALTAIEDFAPDLVLLDAMMPGMSGFELCRKIRVLPGGKGVQVIFLTAQIDLPSRVNALESGADDYLPKPMAAIELTAKVKARLERVRLLKERTERDLLSGLLLRAAFIRQASILFSENNKQDLILSLALLNLDDFKAINVRYGCKIGDAVIAAFGKLLRRRFRVDDLRARWSGAEFALLLRNQHMTTTAQVLLMIQEELGSLDLNFDAKKRLSLTFSAGIASYPADGSNCFELIDAAERRLREAKVANSARIVMEG